MNRRKFLGTTAPVLAIPFLLNGMKMKVFGKSRLYNNLLSQLSVTDKVLVLIQLQGGNDGLNTVIPLDQYSTYNSLRTNIAIPENSVLKLDNATGLHPAMTGLQTLFSDGKLALVQGVSYPNPNLSHFRATDIWMTGSDYNQYLSTGWAGRYLQAEFPTYPDNIGTMQDPLAIQIGATVAIALQSDKESMGIAIQDPNTFYSLVNGTNTGPFDDPPNTQYGNELKFLRQVQLDSQQYSKQIKTAADKAQNVATYPANNSLASQLKIVARLIGGSLQTRIYVVSMGGLDNHSAEVVASDTTTGNHATLLGNLSNAIKAFQDDIKALGVEDRVISMTFSEFGRRVQSNASLGTDHGTALPMFVIGNKVNPKIFGVNPNLSDLDKGNLKSQFDFRQIYTSILAQWFGIDQNELTTVLLNEYTQVPIINTPNSVNDTLNNSNSLFVLHDCVPNPAQSNVKVSFDVNTPSNINLKLYDIFGSERATLVNSNFQPGNYSTNYDVSNLPSGAYFLQLQSGYWKATKKLVVAR
jgi:uncharacterized protein (DUF1501 family)